MKKIPTSVVVVAAALVDGAGRVLVQRRRAGAAHGGLWEFPGGKVEPRETDTAALCRELEEELGLAVRPDALAYLAAAQDDESGLVIRLYTATQWHGTPRALDADALAWCAPPALDGLAMPPLDIPLARAVQTMLAKPK